MKTKNYISILVYTLCCILVNSCDIHQFPVQPKDVEFVLNLDFDKEMPLYKVVDYDVTVKSVSHGQPYDTRYLVNVYDAEVEDSREALYSFVFTKDDVSDLNNSVTLSLQKGNYRFVVWTDYVLEGTVEDLHYNTSKFEYISLAEGEHSGSNDARDAFTGSLVQEVTQEYAEATVYMSRPMAKFNFVSTDLHDFLGRVKEKSLNVSRNSGIGDYKVVFRYNGFMPSAYNSHTVKPTDSATGVSFESTMNQIDDNEVEMGFDYVFTNGQETVVSVAVEVYDVDGTMLSSSKAFDVPLVRSKLTTVKARLLTSDAEGGVAVDPGYQGDHNIVM